MPDGGFKTFGEAFGSSKELNAMRGAVANLDALNIAKNLFEGMGLPGAAKKVENKALYVKVEDSIWKNELKLNQKNILNNINAHFKEQIVNTIKFI
jgi:predicted nucleic acid-binding Zn ribbon protein